jgi:hypothetical protein
MLSILRQLYSDPDTSIFWSPVSTKIFPDYRVRVKDPMDLRTVSNETKMSYFGTDHAIFAKKVNLVWTNCMIYNKGDLLEQLAIDLESTFLKLYTDWIVQPTRPADPDIPVM